nr:reverse transcriptase domain-containing protein [Tanacetum cinerariifolium]
MANTTPLVTTVMKPTNDLEEANTAPRVNIQELCEEYYEDILPIIMEKARHERLKDVHARTRWKSITSNNGKEKPLEDFMERFKIETGRMKGAPECMRIFGFMHGINNPELTKRLNEHVPKTMEEMMIATTAFIRGEAAAASKKKGHGSWKPHDQSKKHADKRPDFRGYSRDDRGTNRFTPLTRTPKEILAAEANKFQPPPPMVTPVEKRNSNKFYDFYNDKGHSKDEYTSSPIPREKKTRPANLTVPLHPNFPDQEVVVGGSLSDKGRTELCALLKKNLGIFAWHPSDMTGVPRSIAEHRLNIRDGCPPVRQKKRGQAPERTKAIQAEVQKLVEARIMREVYYHDWLSNPVKVKKHDGSWRMCVDFTDLNKACPQDYNPLPEID